jgi:quercetin dioxygenase-like cupin family protein
LGKVLEMSNQDGTAWGVDVERRALLERLFGGGLATAIGGGLGIFGGDLSAAGQAGSSAAPVPGIALTRGVRRVITGHNDKGKSYIIRDDRITTGAFPSLYKATGDQPLGPGPSGEPKTLMSTDAPQLEPSLGGSSFHFVTLPPTPKGAKPGWHRTETLDYNILMGGELVLMVDEGETKLFPGDVVIQRNTLHAWRNDTTSPVYWVAVLVPIKKA